MAAQPAALLTAHLSGGGGQQSAAAGEEVDMKPAQNALPCLLPMLLATTVRCVATPRYRPFEILYPSGLLVAIASVNESEAGPSTVLCLRIAIRQRAGGVLFGEQTTAPARMRSSLEWLDDDHLRPSSSASAI
jgi:hypothetical protein